jgi:hypothetical protein
MNGKGYLPQQGLQCCSFPTAQLHDSLQHLRRVPEQMSTPNATLSPSNSSSSSDAAFLAALGVQPSRECSASCRMPMSVYAATKADTETLVGVYVHQYGLVATGEQNASRTCIAPAVVARHSRCRLQRFCILTRCIPAAVLQGQTQRFVWIMQPGWVWLLYGLLLAGPGHAPSRLGKAQHLDSGCLLRCCRPLCQHETIARYQI